MKPRPMSVLCLAFSLTVAVGVRGGDLEPPGSPAPTMKTLQEVEPRTPIHAADIPLTITVSGSYYLAENATGVSGQDGIVIDAPEVTLDLCGFTLAGVGGSGNGILVTANGDRSRVVNGIVKNWGGQGVRADAAESVTVQELTAYNNGSHGIHVRYGGTVRNCDAHNNGSATTSDGIAAEDQSLVIGCLSRNNARYGINVTNESFVTQCSATGNGTGNYLLQTGSSGVGNR